MRLDVILRIAAKLMIPFIMLFAIYVQFHGHYSPGGGFQAGVIIAAAVILYAIVFGISAALRVMPRAAVEFMVPLGVGIYAGTGIVSMLLGRPFLDYDPLLADPVAGQYWGVFIVEVGVLVTVAGAMLAIFYAFALRGRP
ncbi:Na(+)/H(+) antiporter subunit B [Paralimibaculum aggregatum]|uniref:Na(+)/H(+) antiporter subunit B n=1 Tax=Paralimibaculum aggregatum TaxID=3036245 RepID=A0ABQ6LPH4_9RHOB|nr:Na(+)/H(+) antiporter subunit B [Limibaculum sp. NKW23]GMG84339.1 Na(+)/H(+) antiporter subunit B [Limibaculum sp. NKW23]